MEYEIIADRLLEGLLADIGHSGTLDMLRNECELMLREYPYSKQLWAIGVSENSYLVALALRDGEDVILSYFLAFPLDEMDALYWIADNGEIAELEEELEEMISDDSIDWVAGHLGVASGPLLLRTSRAFERFSLPEIIVGVKIREERVIQVD
ncbi:MAG: hypothetical protein DRN78_04310 [Thermoproteota archaeon]|nr:MAG: hypothetical protein DRN78_04310 [Candidatus Korarchaeota archaeon]